jgi:hypothetical protein
MKDEGHMPPSRYRFEVIAAYVVGAALPLLEICRRRSDFSDLPSYADDFIIGALLLWAARSATQRQSYSGALLAGAWGALCGGLWSSLFNQLHNERPLDISGLPNSAAVLIKAVLYCVAIVGFVLSVRRSTE